MSTDTQPFNPNNPEHLKAFKMLTKKIKKNIKQSKQKPSYLVIPKDIYKEIRKLLTRKII